MPELSVEDPDTSSSSSKSLRPCKKEKVFKRVELEYTNYYIQYLTKSAPEGIPLKANTRYQQLVRDRYTLPDGSADIAKIKAERMSEDKAKTFLKVEFPSIRRLYDRELCIYVPKGSEYLYLMRKIDENLIWPGRTKSRCTLLTPSTTRSTHLNNPRVRDVLKEEVPGDAFPPLPKKLLSFDTRREFSSSVEDCNGRYIEELSTTIRNDELSGADKAELVDVPFPREYQHTELTVELEVAVLGIPDPSDTCVTCRTKEFKASKSNEGISGRDVYNATSSIACSTVIYAPHYSGKTAATANLRSQGIAVFETNRHDDWSRYRHVLEDSVFLTSHIDALYRIKAKNKIILLPDEEVYNCRRKMRLRYNKKVSVPTYAEVLGAISAAEEIRQHYQRKRVRLKGTPQPYCTRLVRSNKLLSDVLFVKESQ